MKIIHFFILLIFQIGIVFSQKKDSISIVFSNCKQEAAPSGFFELYGLNCHYESFSITTRHDTQVKMYSLKNPKIRKRKHKYLVTKTPISTQILDSVENELNIYWSNLVQQCDTNYVKDCNNYSNLFIFKTYLLLSNSRVFPYLRPNGFSENIDSSVWLFDSAYIYIITVKSSKGGAGLLSLFENNNITYVSKEKELKWSLIKKWSIIKNILDK